MTARYHVLSEEDLLALLRKVEAGEPADHVYAEHYANAHHEQIPGE